MALTQTMLQAALSLAERGWPVFPIHYPTDEGCSCGRGEGCSSPAKHPITEAGFKDATTDPDTIRGWWTRHPEANIGVPTGAVSGLAVLDIDDPQSFVDLTKQHGSLPATLMGKTGGGGVHLFYRYSDGIRNTAGLWPKIDVRGEGGYILAPPSRHITGRRYAWDDQAVAPRPWPQLLAELQRKPKSRASLPGRSLDEGRGTAYGLAALEKELGILSLAPEGERNDTLNRAAFSVYQLVAGGELDEFSAAQDLRTVASRIGLDQHEIEGTLRSARDAGFGEPRTAPNTYDRNDTTYRKPLNGSSVGSVGSVLEDELGEPIPLQRYRAPGFPLETLPQWLREYVHGLAHFAQVPADVPGCFTLGVVASMLAGKVFVEPTPGWVEPTNVFMAAVLESGERKSAILNEVGRPMRELEKELRDEALPGISEARANKDLAEDAVATARAEAKKASPLERQALEDAVREAAWEADQMEVPAEPRLFTDDATPEAMASLMADQGGRIAVLSAEGTIFDIIAGRYSKDPNLDNVLKGHAGDAMRIDRKNRPSEYIEKPALTIVVAVQPTVIEGLASRREMRGRGVLARFGWSMPSSIVGWREINPQPVADHVRDTYVAEVKRLGRSLSAIEPTHIGFSAEGLELFTAWRWEIEKSLAPGGDLEYLKDWGSKLPGLTARLAGVLHFAEHGEVGVARAISETTTASAVALGRYFMGHAQRVFEHMGADPLTGKAAHVLRWIERQDETEFSQRDIHHGMQSTFQKAADLVPVLNVLVTHGYLRPLETNHSGPGRPPSPRYKVTKSTQPTEPPSSAPPAIQNGSSNGSSGHNASHDASEWGDIAPRLEESP